MAVLPRSVEVNDADSDEEDQLEGPNGRRQTLADLDKHRISHLMHDIPLQTVSTRHDMNPLLIKTLGQSIQGLDAVVEMLQEFSCDDKSEYEQLKSQAKSFLPLSTSPVEKASVMDSDLSLFRVSTH
jgi:hypothetical protein